MPRPWKPLAAAVAACTCCAVIFWDTDQPAPLQSPQPQQQARSAISTSSSSANAAPSTSVSGTATAKIEKHGENSRQGSAAGATDTAAADGHTTAAATSNSNDSDSDRSLQHMYLARYHEIKTISKNVPTEQCPSALTNHNSPCWVQGCKASFFPIQERLGRILQTQQPITKEQSMVIDSMAHQPKHVDLVFVTAASSNHFDETQGLIRDLHRLVFPELQRLGKYTFHFYYYDLGLTSGQVQKLKTHCNCTVLPFPFSRLPYMFHKLSTCIWKPLILKAHLRFSQVTLWMDASVRFRTNNITPILQQTQRLGILVARDNFMLPKHVHPAMLSYFQVQPCLLASFYEISGGFVALSSDVLVHRAVVDPWVACAFSPKCLCPSEHMRDCQGYLSCKPRGDPYFQCHRYDQSALGIILTLLFDWRVSGLAHPLVDDSTAWFSFRRGDRVKYFP